MALKPIMQGGADSATEAALAALENYANNPTPPSRREARWGLLRLLWDVSGQRRIRKCRRVRVGEVVGVRHGAAGAGFSGLATCGSVWACPVCSAKILATRSIEIGAGLLSWENRGGQLVMGTLTMRHHAGQPLASEWDALRRAWDSVVRSRVWAKWRDRLGSPGYVLVTEVTFGDNGWHVHLHFVLLIGGEVQGDEVDSFRAWLLGKWTRALAAAGMPGALDVGQDVHLVGGVDGAVQLGEYLAKSTAYGAAESLGRELMGTWTKLARGLFGTIPAWRLAEEFRACGDKSLLDLWQEYETGSKGRRQCTWSRGLRALLELGTEQTDEDIAAAEAGDSDLVRITPGGWRAVLAAPWAPSRILDVVESGGLPALREFLTVNGIGFLEVDQGLLYVP